MKTPHNGEVGIRELRDGLSRFLDRVQGGESLVVTDRGRAIAKIIPLGLDSFDRLVAEGAITLPHRARSRPSPRRLKSGSIVSDLVVAERHGE